MKKIYGFIGLLVALVSVNFIPANPAGNDDLVQLKALNARFIHNFVTNDVISHDQIIHPDFVCITTKGKWINRSEYLEQWKTGFDPAVYLYWDYRNEKITIIGSTALVRSVNKYIIMKDGNKTTGMTQYTDTYVKDRGVWKCIQAQLTVVTPENYPGEDTIVKKYVGGVMMK